MMLSQIWNVPLPWTLTHPHTIADAVADTLITIQLILILFRVENTTSMISHNNSKCGVVRSQHTIPLCVSPFQMNSGREKKAVFRSLGIVKYIVDVATNFVNWQWFSKEFLRLCGNILSTMMQCHLRDWRAVNVGFQPCRSHAEISPDSLTLLMMDRIIYLP